MCRLATGIGSGLRFTATVWMPEFGLVPSAPSRDNVSYPRPVVLRNSIRRVQGDDRKPYHHLPTNAADKDGELIAFDVLHAGRLSKAVRSIADVPLVSVFVLRRYFSGLVVLQVEVRYFHDQFSQAYECAVFSVSNRTITCKTQALPSGPVPMQFGQELRFQVGSSVFA